jgi:putative oxidoreductase
MDVASRVRLPLLLMRLGVFVVMLMWTLDKLLNPEHAGAVFARFYGVDGVGPPLLVAIALAELGLLAAFVVGFAKRWSYGLVLLFHAISTLASWRQYLEPWEHLLFFAAWPMLAACFALFRLRDLDTLGTLAGPRGEDDRSAAGRASP